MNSNPPSLDTKPDGVEELSEKVAYHFAVSRRNFVQFLGAGLLVVVNAGPVLAQRSGGRGGTAGVVRSRVLEEVRLAANERK